MNYPTHIVYEIYTNQGFFYISQNKTNDKLEVINGVATSFKDASFQEFSTNKDKTFFVPPLQ